MHPSFTAQDFIDFARSRACTAEVWRDARAAAKEGRKEYWNGERVVEQKGRKRFIPYSPLVGWPSTHRVKTK